MSKINKKESQIFLLKKLNYLQIDRNAKFCKNIFYLKSYSDVIFLQLFVKEIVSKFWYNFDLCTNTVGNKNKKQKYFLKSNCLAARQEDKLCRNGCAFKTTKTSLEKITKTKKIVVTMCLHL